MYKKVLQLPAASSFAVAMAEGFYITLPSNASCDIFKNNTSSNFRVDLAHHIDLEGAWEVAVTDITYPHSWYTVNKEQAFFHYVDSWQNGAPAVGVNKPLTVYANLKQTTVTFQDGVYEDKFTILQQLNDRFKAQATDIRLSYDEIKRKFKWVGSGRYAVCFFPPLCYVLGLKEGEMFQVGPGPHLSPYPEDIKAGFDHMYFYSDIVKHQIVGDAYAPLLRSFKIDGKYGEIISHSFNPPQYIPVAKNHIENIHIEIKTDQNIPVNFKYGKTIVKLHFRPNKTTWLQ